jgi:hypothetical protein
VAMLFVLVTVGIKKKKSLALSFQFTTGGFLCLKVGCISCCVDYEYDRK